jgi:hypothetical protein
MACGPRHKQPTWNDSALCDRHEAEKAEANEQYEAARLERHLQEVDQ